MNDQQYDLMGRLDYDGLEVRLGWDETEGQPAVLLVDPAIGSVPEKVVVSLTRQRDVYQLIHLLLKALEEA